MAYIGKVPSAVPLSGADIPANSIDASKLVDGSITIADIADDAVTEAKLANAINSAIAANTAKTGITSGQASAITANTAKTGITSSQASAITANTAKVTNAITTHTGDVTGATSLTITDDAVTAAKLANSINTDIATGVTGNTTANAALPKAGGTMTGNLILNGTVSASKMFTPPLYATDTAANTGGANVNGGIYHNTTYKVLKSFNGSTWRNAGSPQVFSSTFDFLQDNSATSLHRLNNTLNDTGGLYTATSTGSSFTTTNKFGSHAINTMGDGTYIDIAGIPQIYAVSLWYYCVGSDNGYIVDFRHDGPNNGRSYLYTHSGGGSQNINWTNDTTTTARTGDMWINGTVFNAGQYNLTAGNWYHIVMSANSTDTHRTWDQGIRIGNRSDGTTEGNSGYFDQIRTFNRALIQADVTALYAETET